MNETMWLASTDASALINYLRGPATESDVEWRDQDWRPVEIKYPNWQLSQRKRCLFVAGCCRRIWALLSADRFREFTQWVWQTAVQAEPELAKDKQHATLSKSAGHSRGCWVVDRVLGKW
jgi:hypothetical protein